MIPSNERQMAHARAVRARGSAMPPEGLPSPEILDSWVRCMEAGLDAAVPHQVQVVEAGELAQRRERSEFVRRLAQAELETLSQQIAGSNFLLAFADVDGVILDLFTDNRFTMSGSDAGILAGSCWAETLCGTNGLGTALASGGSVAVSGLEHYAFQLGGISCTAAPVRDAQGEVVGVLDAASYFESRQRHTLALVQMAATHIEQGLLLHQMRAEVVLSIHPRAEYLGTLSAGLLAFDGQGRLLAANGRARSQLAGLESARGTAFESLFGEPFDLVMARLHVGQQTRLRDALGSALVASLVSRPPMRALARAPLRPTVRPTSRLPARDAQQILNADAPLPPGQPRPAPAFVSDDPVVAEACRLVQGAVRMAVPVLIAGDTGTGKELLARHAHACSGRSGAFVAVNCGALPDELFEAELFGYAPGAFTGARREGSAGLIVSADGGTLLLDEVRELPLHLQAALLRFLDDQRVRPVGGTATRHVDVQVLAATNVDLEDEVAARRFRADLLYRLNTVKVQLPPLRSRRDFAAAARQVLAAIDPLARLDDGAVQRLAQHGWPGNFRELRSVLTRALLASGAEGGPVWLGSAAVDACLPAAPVGAGGSALQQGATERVLREYERCGHSVSRAARALGISRTTVYRHLAEAGSLPRL